MASRGFLVFSGQGILSGEEQVQCSKFWGAQEMHSTHGVHPQAPNRHIFRLSNDNSVGITGVGPQWHNDGSFEANIFSHVGYHIIRVPEQGGDTEFVHQGAAFDALPKETQDADFLLHLSPFNSSQLTFLDESHNIKNTWFCHSGSPQVYSHKKTEGLLVSPGLHQCHIWCLTSHGSWPSYFWSTIRLSPLGHDGWHFRKKFGFRWRLASLGARWIVESLPELQRIVEFGFRSQWKWWKICYELSISSRWLHFHWQLGHCTSSFPWSSYGSIETRITNPSSNNCKITKTRTTSTEGSSFHCNPRAADVSRSWRRCFRCRWLGIPMGSKYSYAKLKPLELILSAPKWADFKPSRTIGALGNTQQARNIMQIPTEFDRCKKLTWWLLLLVVYIDTLLPSSLSYDIIFWCLTCLGDAVTSTFSTFEPSWGIATQEPFRAKWVKKWYEVMWALKKKVWYRHFEKKKRFAQELLEELQELSYQVLSNQKKALPAHVVGLRHDRTRSVRVSVGCAKHGDIWWRVESFFWWLKFLGEGGLWDESWFLALQSISNSSHSLSIPTRPTLLYSFSSYSILTLRHLFPHDLPIRSIFHMTFSASSDFMTEKKANL